VVNWHCPFLGAKSNYKYPGSGLDYLFPRENILDGAKRKPTDLDSIELLCWSTTCWDVAAATTIAAIRYDLLDWWPANGLDDATIVVVLQSFLQCKQARSPPLLHQQRVWEHFFKQHHPLIRRAVARACRGVVPPAEYEDLSQEIWREIVTQLPKLTYNSARASLSSWLAGLVRQKIRRLVNCALHCLKRGSLTVEGLAELLQSEDLSPEDVCFLKEALARLEAILAKLRRQMSPETYEVFCRRFFGRERFKDIAAALELTSDQTRFRYQRARKKWRALTRSWVIFGRPVSDSSPPKSPPPRRAR
jgi:RNA polymerase sigma factor (sigma-70 family)